MRPTRRALLAVLIQAGAFAVIGAAFWEQDWQYSVPTPRPEDLSQPALGERPALPAAVGAARNVGRPLVIHFANARCPCSKFVLDHVRSLRARFGGAADFLAVLETNVDPEVAEAEFRAMQLHMPGVVDPKGEVSTALGVYGTPQAVILDGDGRLYYRGNYNQSRFCPQESTEYVRLALTALAGGQTLPRLPKEAFIPFGCPLPRRSGAAFGDGSGR
jgi:hypothetical protein